MSPSLICSRSRWPTTCKKLKARSTVFATTKTSLQISRRLLWAKASQHCSKRSRRRPRKTTFGNRSSHLLKSSWTKIKQLSRCYRSACRQGPLWQSRWFRRRHMCSRAASFKSKSVYADPTMSLTARTRARSSSRLSSM